MSTDTVRALLILLGVGLNFGATVSNSRDRARREKALSPGHRPPVRYTRNAKILTGFAVAAFVAALPLFFV